jgi:serine/threonine-protein kinase
MAGPLSTTTRPELFGSCRVVSELGAGSLTTVYHAVDEALGRDVAVKALKSSLSTTSSFAAQLVREAKILSELCHPNIAALHELVKTERELYLVIEYVNGPSLHDILARRAKLVPEAAGIIGAAVANALDHAHEHGIVHRDVKPANILISLRGEVKLIDFGIADRLRSPDGDPALEFHAFGTPAYMSPEQILGDTADVRSDLFSLGVVLYQMLTGRRPFEVDDANDRRSSTLLIRRAPATPLRSIAPEVPRPFERIVMRLLEKLPADRYASAGALRDDLLEQSLARVRGSSRGVVARALRDAGFAQTQAPEGELTLAVEPPLRPIYLGFAVILAFGCVLGLVVQLGDPQDREAARAGATPLELVPKDHASLRIHVVPWADVSIDGQHVDTTPIGHPIPLAPGRHFVTFTHPDAPSEQRAIKLAPGEQLFLDVAMALPSTADTPRAIPDAGPGASR